MRRRDGTSTRAAVRRRAAARHRPHGRELAPPLLVGVAEDDAAEAPVPPSHLNVVPAPAPLNESAP
ncbi:hypothetical protein [Myxococcus sp. Y35]|uniref:hypothetical protein n=1 Tax=Pseudomyxococcus flavus TaxID=3115648 RepID=UPI003CE74B50